MAGFGVTTEGYTRKMSADESLLVELLPLRDVCEKATRIETSIFVKILWQHCPSVAQTFGRSMETHGAEGADQAVELRPEKNLLGSLRQDVRNYVLQCFPNGGPVFL